MVGYKSELELAQKLERVASAERDDIKARESHLLSEHVHKIEQLEQLQRQATMENEALAHRLNEAALYKEALAQRLDEAALEKEGLAQRLDEAALEKDALARRVRRGGS